MYISCIDHQIFDNEENTHLKTLHYVDITNI